MNRHCFALSFALVAGLPMVAHAADHIDSPAATAEPSADITDLYAWMNDDASVLRLVMNVHPFAAEGAGFSSAVQYAFHVGSSAGYGMPDTETLILCRFDEVGQVECWAGDDEYLTGDATSEAGIRSASGRFRVFTGMRNDPFFMEFTGFTNAVATVVSVAGALDYDEHSCPLLDGATSDALVGQLQSTADGDPATDTFAGQNVLSIVVEVDKELVSPGGPLFSVWASTHRAN